MPLLQLLGELVPVSFHVLLAVERGLKGFLAVGTHVGPEVVVGAHVAPQAAPRGESPTADGALEGLEPCVCAYVGLEHSCRHETPPALRALEGFFACVGPDMLLKVARLLIRTVAVETLVRSVCFTDKIIVKITLEKLVFRDGLDKTQVRYENWLLQRNVGHWDAGLANAGPRGLSLVPHFP